MSYVVPQKITSTEKDVKLFFRVKKQLKVGNIILVTAGKEIMSIKRAALTPGEMQSVIVKNTVLKQSEGSIELKVLEQSC